MGINIEIFRGDVILINNWQFPWPWEIMGKQDGIVFAAGSLLDNNVVTYRLWQNSGHFLVWIYRDALDAPRIAFSQDRHCLNKVLKPDYSFNIFFV
jgi:hypothetical protein